MINLNNKEYIPKSGFSKVTISLASPDSILEKSYGEVIKPETINYRTYKPEREGLFCEKIFGPTKDYECACGKYKRIRYKNLICDRCGVEVTEKKVRRERMGHIKLMVPVLHVWYFRSLPNKIGYLLGLSSKQLESIIYYEKYVVVKPGVLRDKGVKVGDLLTEDEYNQMLDTLPETNHTLLAEDPDKFIAKMGAESIHDMLVSLDLNALSHELRYAANNETSQQRKAEALKRLTVVEAFRQSQTSKKPNKPEWMVIQYVAVLPPELRPLVPLDGGKFASADLNDLYRRVIIRNNRLKRLMEIKAPEVILRNEKRMLQEAMDALIDNSRKSSSIKVEGGRPLKSLSDVLKGKQGRFRQNLLGKRVDYSGRSVVVVGPNLKLHECGIPKFMAAELFKPFIIRRILDRGIAKTLKSAKKIVDRKDALIWDILENLLPGHPVMLNRAPTLHRLSIQSFQPKLIEGKAIQLHPLVCAAFNADFDGDQMAVHVPLSNAAIAEAQLLMLSSHNILNPQNGTPITLPSQDMVLGLYYLSKEKKSTPTEKILGEGKIFYSDEEVIVAFNEKKIHLHACIKLKIEAVDNGQSKTAIIDTTVGRVLFNRCVPKEVGFVNMLLTKKNLRTIIGRIVEQTDLPTTSRFLDDIKNLGFSTAFKGGLSFSLNDLVEPTIKKQLVDKALNEVKEITDNYSMGFITNNERYNQIIDVWSRVDMLVTEELIATMAKDKQGFNAVYMMLDSGARGSKQQVKQLVGLRGLMAKPRKSGESGSEIVENPILSNFKEGLSVLEYFISTHGARKGLADTALKTADAGYLTRRLVDVAQDVVINEEDCGTLRGIEISALKDNEEIVERLSERIHGRVILNDVHNIVTNELLAKAGTELTVPTAQAIEDAGIESVQIRSVLTCESKQGVCKKCYGKNLATGQTAQMGDAVGIIAAQSIGEPGTQLTLRTFHVGGIAGSSAIDSKMTSKFDGIVKFESVRMIKTENQNGEVVTMVIGRTGEIKIISPDGQKLLTTQNIPYGSILYIKDGGKIAKGDIICSWDPFNNLILSELKGHVRFDNIIEGITFKEEVDEQTGHREKVIIESKDKTKIPSLIVESSNETKIYNLPVGSHIVVKENDSVRLGQTLGKIPRILGKLKDITGGLPRVTELIEARKSKSPAVVTEIDGVISLGAIKRGNREIIVTSKEGLTKKYFVPLSKQILVQEGDYVKACSPLSDGDIAAESILAIKGSFAVQQYILNEIQEVYRLQGVNINDKHIEVIVKQMMRKVSIQDAGDSIFLEGELVSRDEFLKVNDSLFDKRIITEKGDSKFSEGQMVTLRELRDEVSLLRRSDKTIPQSRETKQATSMPCLLGITRASLGVNSWISAASFQETTKVLSQAAIESKQDDMLGLKENVIAGQLIPAGTGQRKYSELIVASREEYEMLKSTKEAMTFDEHE